MERNHERSFPREIISKILIELPAKCVVRFSCVSRTWLSIIEDPYFVKSHHARSYTRPGGINLIVYQQVSDYNEYMTTCNVFYTNSEGKSPLKRLKPPDFLRSSVDPNRSSSVHGLVCAGNCIWNPTTNESIVLPPISLTTLVYGEYFSYKYMPKYYLEFDSTNNSYKVLCILQICHSKMLDSGAKSRGGTQVFKILVVGGSSWRDVESPSELVHFYFTHDSCSVDNLICFLISQSVLAFDVRCEKFKKIPIPDDLTYPYHRMVQVGGCISLVNTKFEIMWILEDYEKCQWRSERLEIGPLLIKGMKPMYIISLGANHNGEILFEVMSNGRKCYYYYDIETKIGRKVFKLTRRINGINQNPGADDVSVKTHVESLYRFK